MTSRDVSDVERTEQVVVVTGGLDSTGSGEDAEAIIPGLAPSVSAPTRTPPGQPHTPPFDIVLRGYDRRQVDARMNQLLDRVSELTAALEASAQREASAVAAAERATAELERGRPSFDALGERVAEMLRLAEAEAAEMRASARRDAGALRERAARDAQEARRAADREVEGLQQRWSEVLTQVSAAHGSLGAILEGSRTIGNGTTVAVAEGAGR